MAPKEGEPVVPEAKTDDDPATEAKENGTGDETTAATPAATATAEENKDKAVTVEQKEKSPEKKRKRRLELHVTSTVFNGLSLNMLMVSI